MENILELTYQYFDLFLIAILIFIVTLILGIFIKKRIALFIVMASLIIGSLFVVNLMKHTTLLELYSNQLNENSDVKSISIIVNDNEENIPEKTQYATIEDEEIIAQIIEDFSKIELKKDDDIPSHYREYDLELIVENQIKEDFYKTTSIDVNLDESYLNNYKIVSETNHLKTIKSLLENDKIDWKVLD